MRSFLLLLVGLTVGAPTPTPSPTPAIPLAGTWTFGGTNEPKEAIVTLRPGCYAGFEAWNLDQDGAHVTASLYVHSPVTGVQPAFVSTTTEKVSGDLVGNALTLTGTHDVTWWDQAPGSGAGPKDTHDKVTYVLRWDPKTKHLVGTRNGQAFWAAKAVVIPEQPCGPPPP